MDELYSNWFLSNTTAAANMSTDKMPTIDDLDGMAKQFNAMKHEHDRSMADICQNPCRECGRRPILTSGALQVCQHLWAMIWAFPRNSFNDGEPPPLGGLRIELFNDGPARF